MTSTRPEQPPENSPPAQEENDCVECNVFQKGICLTEFKAFDSCFERVQSAGRDEAECMDLFDAFRSCYAKKSRFQSIMESAVKGRASGG